MFTGIITNLGEISDIKINNNKDLLLKVRVDKTTIKRQLEIGCSISCNGICLTLIKKTTTDDKIDLSFQASQETCEKTTLKNWKIGQIINLEFALRMGDELGGHMVLGHVDDIAQIIEIKQVKESHKFTFSAPKNLMKFISEKGSVTLDGTSLTINEVDDNKFSINIIWHTLENTIFKNLKENDLVNLEVDAMARYAYKILQK